MSFSNPRSPWNQPFDTQSESVNAEPVLAGDVLVIAGANNLYGAGIYDGVKRWSKEIKTGSITEIAAANGTIFFVGAAGDWGGRAGRFAKPVLVALDAATGIPRQSWKKVLHGVAGLKHPRVENGVVTVSDGAGNLYGFDAATAAPLWTTRISSATPQSPSIGDDAVFLLADDVVHAVNVRSGQRRWQFPDPQHSGGNASAYLLEAGDALGSQTSLFAGNGMVIVNGEKAIYAIDWKLGRKLWTIDVPETESWNPPVVSWDGGCLFVTSAQGSVRGYPLSAAEQQALTPAGSPFWASTLTELAAEGHVTGQSGGFLRPVIESDVPVIDAASGHLNIENRIFLPAATGAVFIMNLAIQGDGPVAGKYKVTLDSSAENAKGLDFAPAVANGALFMTKGGEIAAHAFSPYTAPRFRPETSSITLPNDARYSFGTKDFSLEAWVRTTTGGQVITRSGDQSPQSTGFRLEVVNAATGINCADYGEGRVQFTISDAQGVLLFAQTEPTEIADGIWHHLALVRTGNAVAIFIDGISRPTGVLVSDALVPKKERGLLPKDTRFFSPSRLSGNITIRGVTSAQPVVVGAYAPAGPSFSDPDAAGFDGLISDVRIWNTALNAEQVHDRMAVLLTGHEPGLVAYLPLNDSSLPVLNLCDGSGKPAAAGIDLTPTNLALDNSLFPYLINHITPQWPNNERWIARGQHTPLGSPAACGEVLAFATDKRLYAVDVIHGKRQWAQDLAQPVPPAADGRRFYAMDGAVVAAFDPDSGARLWETDLTEQTPKSGPPANPRFVVTRNCVAASADGKLLFWLDKRNGNVAGHCSIADESSLLADGNRVYVLGGGTLRRFDDPALTGGSPEMKPNVERALPTSGTPAMCAEKGLLFVYDGAKWVQRFDVNSPTLDAPVNSVWSSPPIGNGVSGMAASKSANRLVLSTGGGTILFLEYGSGKQIATASIPGHLFAPVIHGDLVYCTAAGATNCVAIFDLRTGHLRGREDVTSPPVGAPRVAAGTAFFGCGPTAAADSNAMHSVVFGDTLSLDRVANDSPLSVPNVDAAMTAGGDAFNDGNFSLEVWMNSSDGGAAELLSVPPGTGSHAGFRLSLGAAGEITAQHDKTGAGTAFVSQPTAVSDGRWHHVAAVFRSVSPNDDQQKQQVCQLYLDGAPLQGVAFQDGSTVPPPADHRAVVIGGSGDARFHGMLEEVRVWNSWLHGAEVSGRRNVRLRGDEPDLVACWRFTDSSIQDASGNQLNNTATGTLGLRLTDLSFVAPNYPYLTAVSKPVGPITTQPVPNGHGSTITIAQFTTTINARAADGSPRAGTKLALAIDNIPASTGTLTITGPGIQVKSQSATVVSCTGTTDGDGRVVLTITIKVNDSKAEILSPLIRVNADFMYANEYFVVSPLVDHQSHVTVPAPRLTAQSALIQDYSYTTGDKLGTSTARGEFELNDKADVTRIHTTITALSGRDEPMPAQELEIWGDDHVTIECLGISYDVNPHNSARLKTGADGTVTIEFHEASNPGGNLLSSPTLQVRAGFMPRSQRFVVDPAENCHKSLAKVDGSQVSGETALAPDKPKKALVPKTLIKAGKAGAVASLLNQMASLALKQKSAPPRFAAAAVTAPDVLTPNPALAPADSIASVHGRAHLRYDAPITPEYMPSRHCVLTLGDKAFTYKAFDSSAALDGHIKTLKLGNDYDALVKGLYTLSANDPAGGWLHSVGDDIKHGWDEVKHGAEHAWDKAKNVVVKTWDEVKDDVKEVAHFVEVVVTDESKAIGKWVIKTVGDVVQHVVAFLNKIGTILKELYDFLRALFDWKQIVEVHDVIRDMINANLQGLQTELEQTIPDAVSAAFSDVKQKIAGALGVAKGQGAINSYRGQASGASATCISHTNSGKSKYLMNNLRKHGNDTRSVPVNALAKKTPAPDSPLGALGAHKTNGGQSDLNSDFLQLIADIQAAATQPGGLTHLTLHEVLVLLDDFINVFIDVVEQVVKDVAVIGSFAIKGIIEILNYEIELPLITSLYELITGDSLTILDLLSLLVAVPVNVVLAVMGIDFDKNQAESAFNAHRVFSAPAAHDAAGSSSLGVKFADVGYLLFTIINGLVTAENDYLQGNINAEDPKETGGEDPEIEVSTYKFIVGVLTQFTSMGSAACLWVVRNSITGWNWSSVGVYLELASPLLHAGLAAGMGIMRGFDKTETYGRVKKIQLEPLLSIIGVALIIDGLITTIGITGDDSITGSLSDESIVEGVLDITGGLDLSMAFLNWAPVVRESEVDGVPTSPSILSAIDLACVTALEPVLHISAGYGKRVFGGDD